jgi:oxygen-independent coproporphyrinogen-3 oxidase
MQGVLKGTGEAPSGIVEHLSSRERAGEAVMLGLRRCEGIDPGKFAERFGESLESLAGDAYARMIEDGLLESSAASVRLTRRGRGLADTVIGEFLSL